MRPTAGDFTDWLEEVPLAIWRGAAVGCPSTLPKVVADSLERALGARAVALDIWNTKDDVDAALWRFTSAEGRWLAGRRRLRLHIALVTERAALALVVRQRLGKEAFAHAFGGFAAHFPP